MPSLSDRIDHLATTAKAIHTAAAAIVPSEDNPVPRKIPFTRAVLDTSLGDLIRDIDASELGLFTIVPAPDADVRKQTDNPTRRGEISRVAFPGATPLKRRPPTGRRDDMFKPKEYEPEVYAHAALKYLDRYQSIRPMPRARSQVIALIEQLDETRDNIKKLNESLQELTSAGITSGPSAPTTGVAEEEYRITDLQNRLAELRSQKDAMLRSNEPKQASKPKAAPKPIPKPSRTPSPEPEPGNHEDAFWTTPVTSGRTLRFTDRLLADEPDFAELSAISVSPGPAPPKSVLARLAAGSATTDKHSGTLTKDNVFGGPGEDEDAEDLHDQSSLLEEPELDPDASVLDAPDAETEETEEGSDEEKTIILTKVIKETPDSPLLSSSVNTQPQPPQLAEAQLDSDPPSKAAKVRPNPELEKIISRIWSTVGDILLPGQSGGKPPRAQETLDLIESLARSPSPNSPTPSISSMTSCTSATTSPTPHQVNTAQLLRVLLTAPNHAIPLNQLKVAIGSTRALYACVAKKLIRIDRGSGEQVVLFDVGI
ncbi:hypothetical protein JVU11DRAFT_2499 [Chiua virens]|nr:hypothetical protein JVU11DRAFT_2499 [Chiua virens]